MSERDITGTPPLDPGTRVPGPTITGIVLLDKPGGLSSNAALQKVKRALRAGKAGHAGTLDPLATGMLPILLGEATKVARHLLHKDKSYRVECRLGQSTNTYDAEGEITRERPVPALDRVALEGLLAGFTGRIRQRAPAYSAIKQGGQPLYRRVRRGETVEPPEREVVIQHIRLESLAGPSLVLTVDCGSGTYIRSLVHDLGELLGCGAHVGALRRLWVDPFRNAAMVTLDEVLAGRCDILPTLAALSDWPTVRLDPEQLAAIGHGRSIEWSGGSDHPVAALDDVGRLVALMAPTADGRLQPQRLLHPAPGSP